MDENIKRLNDALLGGPLSIRDLKMRFDALRSETLDVQSRLVTRTALHKTLQLIKTSWRHAHKEAPESLASFLRSYGMTPTLGRGKAPHLHFDRFWVPDFTDDPILAEALLEGRGECAPLTRALRQPCSKCGAVAFLAGIERRFDHDHDEPGVHRAVYALCLSCERAIPLPGFAEHDPNG
jgi:hypothetical protein